MGVKGVIFFHLPLWFIQEKKREVQDCFSNIPGQNGILTQTVLIIKVLVSFTKPKMVQSDPNDCVISSQCFACFRFSI